MSSSESQRSRRTGVDAEIGHRLIEVKSGVAALRTVRMALMQLAYSMAERPGSAGFLVLPDIRMTPQRLREEWRAASSVLRPEIAERMTVCVIDGDRCRGIPRDPDPETQRILAQAVADARRCAQPRVYRPDAPFVVLKILLHHWLTDGGPMTTDSLCTTAGLSYRSVANVLRGLGGLIERSSDRRIRLRWFPKEEFARLIATSDRARSTIRFMDQSGQPRSPDSHLRRLTRLDLSGIAIGGVLGAKHYFPDLDLVGSPRLDLSIHCPGRRINIDFVEQLDPALAPVSDPLQPAHLVLHAVRHADALFTPRDGGPAWADPIECLLDLYEAHLDMQASQFLDALQGNRPRQP